MEAPVSSAHNFHNRFATSDATNAALNEKHEDNDTGKGILDFQFDNLGSMPDISTEEVTSSASAYTALDKKSDPSHNTTSTPTNRRSSKTTPADHVAALEEAAEIHVNTLDEAIESERRISSSAIMYNSPPEATPAPPLNVNFQHILNGGGASRFALPQPPSMDVAIPDKNRRTSGPSMPVLRDPFQGISPPGSVAFPASSSALDDAIGQLNFGNRIGSGPDSTSYGSAPRARQGSNSRSRPSSFFGMERPSAAIEAAANGIHGFAPRRTGSDAPSFTAAASDRDGEESLNARKRHSSFFGMEEPLGRIPDVDRHLEGQTVAARIAASHRNAELNNDAEQVGLGGNGSNSTTRRASIAGTTSGALLDHSHLKPGMQAALLSHNKTLELYRQNAKKTNDPNLIYEFAVFMVDASKSMGADDSSGGTGGASGTDYTPGKEEHAQDELAKEAIGLLKKIAERGHMDAQYFLADCYANGIGSPKGKQDFDKAYPLFVLAAKHGHPDAAYRAGTCYEKGWGCRKDVAKALQFYRKAASQSHPGAMYRLATAELNGDLGLKKSAREGVKWLKRSAESATPEFPHALHELALLHERGIDNVLFVDEEYACELLAQSAEMGYAPSAYKLGVNYEYGRMGCPQDGGLSIHMYNIAAQQNHKEACFALTAWYLVGAPGILPQSDTEAYLWAKKAAEQGLAKAEYAVGYFTEMGIGTVKGVAEARAWYRSAAEHGDRRANQRLSALGGQPVPMANELAGKEPSRPPPQQQQHHSQHQHLASHHGIPPPMQGGRMPPPPMGMRNGGGPLPPHALSSGPGSGPPMSAREAREQGQRVAAEQTQRMIAQAEVARQQGNRMQLPPNGIMSPGSDRSSMLPPHLQGPGSNYPPSIASRDTHHSQREQSFQMGSNQQRSRAPPMSSAASSQHRVPYGADIAYSSMPPPQVQASQSPYSKPPPGRQQGAMPPFIPTNNAYPVYPSELSSADPIHLPAPAPPVSSGTPPPGSDKKKQSLWSQIKQM